MAIRFAVVVFPGTNCDSDTKWAVEALGYEAELVWHTTDSLDRFDCVILPGGFAHGDYLRTGAIAAFSPIIRAVREYAKEGGLVLGICNGFQILLETGILPGAMIRNRGLRFICRFVDLFVEQTQTPFTLACDPKRVLRIPISHFEGSYYIDQAGLETLMANDQIVLRYCDERGNCTAEANPNGAMYNIAGICNKTSNVFGLMPHPERACEEALGSADGRLIFKSIDRFIKSRRQSDSPIGEERPGSDGK